MYRRATGINVTDRKHTGFVVAVLVNGSNIGGGSMPTANGGTNAQADGSLI